MVLQPMRGILASDGRAPRLLGGRQDGDCVTGTSSSLLHESESIIASSFPAARGQGVTRCRYGPHAVVERGSVQCNIINDARLKSTVSSALLRSNAVAAAAAAIRQDDRGETNYHGDLLASGIRAAAVVR